MKPHLVLSLGVALWLISKQVPAQTLAGSQTLPAGFAADWARDSLGCDGFRAAHYTTLLAAGVLRGQSSTTIGRLLGPPNVQKGQGRAFMVVYSFACTDMAGIDSKHALRKHGEPSQGQSAGREMTRLLILEFKQGKCKKAHLFAS